MRFSGSETNRLVRIRDSSLPPTEPDLINAMGYLSRLYTDFMFTGVLQGHGNGTGAAAGPSEGSRRMDVTAIAHLKTAFGCCSLVVHLHPDRIGPRIFITFAP